MKLSQITWLISLLIATGLSAVEAATAAPLSLELIKTPKISATVVTEARWLAQNPSSVVITGVQIKSTDTGLEIILETDSPQSLQPIIYPEDKNLIIEILDALLQLPEAEVFQADNPTPEITSVTVSQVDATTVVITVTGETATPGAEVVLSPDNLVLSVTPDATTATPEEELEIVATGERTDSYFVPEASSGTKIEIPVLDFPGSIQVIPEQVIENRRVIRLNELGDNVAGVQPQSGYGGLSSQQSYIRGFPANDNLRNGFRDFAFISPRDVANVDRVEFLKGPASVLYGNIEPGGIINTITKQPLTNPFYDLNMTIGSYNFYRPSVDLTGPITDDESLLYRLNIAYENSESFRDFYHNESILAAPVMTFNIGEKTQLTVEFNYQNYDYYFDRAFLPSEVFLDLPISRVVLGEPDYNNAEFDSYYISYNFEHKFSDNWRLRQGFGALITDGNVKTIQPGNYSEPFLEPDGQTLPREAQKTDEYQENYSLQTEVIGEFNTGSIRHNLLFGVELFRYQFAYTFFNAPIGSINIFNPVYGAEPGEFTLSFSEEYGSDNLGIYVQDLVELLPNLKLLVGARFDWADVFYRDRVADQDYTNFSEFAVSPRAGIVYQPTPTTAVYFSWSKSFNPQIFAVSSTGEAFEPERGEQFEIGVKQEFFEGRLLGTLALYEITKTNVLTTDPADPNFSIATGEQTSNGIELELVGEILPGWNVIATYAYTNAYVSEDNSLPVGDKLAGIPLNSASLWTTYEIQNGTLEGLGFGLGIYYVDVREGQLPNTGFLLPSYVRTDAAVFYRRNNYQIALNVKNLFDVDYYETQGFYVTPQAPLTFLGNISVQF